MTLSRSSMLFYWSPALNEAMATIGGNPVHSRNSAAKWIDQGGKLQSAIVNTPRFEWADLGDGLDRRKILRLEQARTNLISLAVGSWVGADPVATGKSDPTGGTAAVELTDTGSPRIFTVGFTGNATKGGVICLRQSDPTIGQTTQIGLFDGSVSTWRHYINVIWNNGVPTLTTAAGAGVRLSRQLVGGWWEIDFTANGVIAANTNNFYIYADAGNNSSKKVQVFLPTAQNAASPGSLLDLSSTRAADAFRWALPFPIQALFAYIRFIERGTIFAAASTRLFEIGTVAAGGSRIIVYNPAGAGTSAYRGYQDNGSTSVVADLSVLPTVGDTVEIVLRLSAAGVVEIIQSINGAAVTNGGGPSGALALVTSNTMGTLCLNDSPNSVGSFVGMTDYAEMKIAKYADLVAVTAQGYMDELRAFELDARGAVL